ncbi:MAG: acetyl-CoA carboxylase carboxyl transferase subunit alpha [Nitrospirae bacterium CG_4_10_14_0_8_um_filter_41_23]|nr:MAG: acetyl-CoA carboxylase carboxyl transferase subunit alpha [Nitrospirae bacterium CG11_big_fil_rev_8_21_14_0_20_41_14]PIV42150.1 MAG: acetyl-CoA carboxylase carboxyl transferase subunit alpha [Nitrospirae bacterium CG02_land_8_20_14_3_00_41_53]PIW86444.1 MAG: acetyl-CoA carboxylase carboxyl transferase subunit alpha [Nitrospirae bacterium CG_4_8_14_3_um_filter_41_47]PIY87896.1 MAG: acetyl-CoA carboxylase carboxyl transferase subunit alpha [Nitrospirae bacterium CG_4_10_14_0_8_um_filter_41
MRYYLEFEKTIEELELKIEELKRISDGKDIDISSEIKKLEKKVKELRSEIFSKLKPWQKTLIARHPERPYTLDYINLITSDFIELHGDRRFSDDPAIVGGVAKINDIPVIIVGHQKGRGTKERIYRNFGQPHPEGYRKALRLMKLAEKFKRPVITFIDTPGAYPGIGAEERGQAEAIAVNLMEMARLRTPIISIVIGEGGSGGALALGVADRLFMLEHSIYSVISPEGCAAILWKKNGDFSSEDFSKAADALKLTAQDLLSFKIIDGIIPEPLGGAHRDPEGIAKKISEFILTAIEELKTKTPGKLIEERYKKFRKIGSFKEETE